MSQITAGGTPGGSPVEEDKGYTFFGLPLHRRIVTGQREIPWSAAFILSLVWFTWGFHIFAGGLALTFTLQRYTNDPRILAFVRTINIFVVLGPFISYISDQVWTPWGRRRPFVIIAWAAGAIAMFCFAFLPQTAGLLNGWLSPLGIPYITEVILLVAIATAYTTAYDLQATIEPLFLECVPPHQRGRFFAIRGILFSLAVLFFFQVLWPVYDIPVNVLGDTPFLMDYFARSPIFQFLGLGGFFAWLGALNWPSIATLRGEQLIYIFASATFVMTGIFLVFGIRETKVANAPNKTFRQVLLSSGAEGARLETQGEAAVKAAAAGPLAKERKPATKMTTGLAFLLPLAFLAINLIDLVWFFATGSSVVSLLPMFTGGLLTEGSGVSQTIKSAAANAVNPGLLWWLFHVPLLFIAITATAMVITRHRLAPAMIIILLGARVAAYLILWPTYQMFFQLMLGYTDAPVGLAILSFVLSLAFAVIGILVLTRSKWVWDSFGGDPLEIVLAIPVIGFFTQYLIDVFLSWGNYPFYIVLVIPGIEQAVWGDFSNIMQDRQFEYTKANQALWGFPMQILTMLALTPFAGWYADTRKVFPFLVRQGFLIVGLALLTGAYFAYQAYAPTEIRELPALSKVFILASLTAFGCMAMFIWIVETMLSFTGREHTKAWVAMLAIVLGLVVNILLFTNIRMSENYVIPISLFMMLNIANGAFGALLGTFVGPMIYEYMPRSKMGTINAGRGLIGDWLRALVMNIGGWWIVWYSARTIYNGVNVPAVEQMKFDYTSMYLIQFVLFIPAILATAYFLWMVTHRKVLKWGVLEVEGDEIADGIPNSPAGDVG